MAPNKKTANNDTPEKLPLPKALSPSRALDFQNCPQAFFYKAIERRPVPATVATARGSLVHDAAEKIFDHPPEQRSVELAIQLVEQRWEAMREEEKYRHLFVDGTEGGDEAEFIESAREMCRNWFDIERVWNFDPDMREERLEAVVGGVPVLGILDRATKWGQGRIQIADYKTGKSPGPNFERKAFFGMRVYAALYREMYGQTPTELRLIYLKDKKILEMPCNDQVCDSVITELGRLWEAIKKAWERDNWPTKTGPLCNWCAFKDICPAWNTTPVPVADPEDELEGVA